METNLNNLTLLQLKEKATALEIETISNAEKSELIKAIQGKNKEFEKSKKNVLNYTKYTTTIEKGILEVIFPDGYGFLRMHNFLPSDDDIYVSPAQVKNLRLRTGDLICGKVKVIANSEKFRPLLFIDTVNDLPTEELFRRSTFEDLIPIFPNEKLTLETSTDKISTRILDLYAPIGKGQRGLIVAPPKTGKTVLLKEIANAITTNYKDIHLIVLLIDERPEEVTDIQRSITGDNVEIVYSTFDEVYEKHKRVAEMVLERSKRLVEHGKDLVILLDSITRLARAYNLIIPSSGKTLSGGLDPLALYAPKKFFGAARNIDGGGSLTILGTALVDTGSKMDDVIYEEFKGTGNMELVLDKKLSEKRIFPSINIMKSGTRREDLLLTKDELAMTHNIKRNYSNNPITLTDSIIESIKTNKTNDLLIKNYKSI